MKAPSTALLRAFSPIWQSFSTPRTVQGCLAQPASAFSSTATRPARKRGAGGPKTDMRIRLIRYHLQHPKLPPPLRFGRMRALRHWTIHRAWLLHQANLRVARQKELQRQYQSMEAACEALRNVDDYGLTAGERVRLGEPPAQGDSVGRLYRRAMLKHGIWDGVPIEYARIQTDTPPRDGWNHAWTR